MPDEDRIGFDGAIARFARAGIWSAILFAPGAALVAAGAAPPIVLIYGAVAAVVLVALVIRS